jgi:hypothetical protein
MSHYIEHPVLNPIVVLTITSTFITLEFMEAMVGIKTNLEATLDGGELELIDF